MEVDVRVYAENVVDNVLKNRPTPRQWTGGSVNIMWVFSTFLWATVWVCVPILLSDKPTNIFSGLGARFYVWADRAKEEGEADKGRLKEYVSI
jgi:hypothetical protein